MVYACMDTPGMEQIASVITLPITLFADLIFVLSFGSVMNMQTGI